MSDNTKIEWTDATVNAVNGCSVVSPGCTNCYAMRLAGTRLKHSESRAGLTIDTKAGPVWNGITRLNDKALLQPLRWRRARRIFWNAHGDLFHASVPDEWIDRCFAVMALTPQHIHQVLTKRPERMRDYMLGEGFHGGRRLQVAIELMGPMIDEDSDLDPDKVWDLQERLRSKFEPLAQWPLPNVWLGTSVEDQVRADERIPHLLATPAAVRFLSCEPLLGPINIMEAMWSTADPLESLDASIDWVIVGGESGPGARPMHPDWARSLRDKCAESGTAFFFKQWGEWGPDVGPPASGRDRIFEGAGPCAAWRGDHWEFAIDGFAMPLVEGTDSQWLYRLGKRAAGRLLDGVEHSAMPVAFRARS